jgi:hypothetical protein
MVRVVLPPLGPRSESQSQEVQSSFGGSRHSLPLRRSRVLFRTAGPGKAGRMKLLMQDAARRRHPLHVTRTDDTALAGRIPVRDLAVINDGDRFKATMRMLVNATLSR